MSENEQSRDQKSKVASPEVDSPKLNETALFPVPASISASALINAETYTQEYKRSVEDPDQFWAEKASEFLEWESPWTKVSEWDYPKGHIRWFLGGRLNASVNCLDRHLPTRSDKTALIWEGNEPGEVLTFTYQELLEQVCRVANVLKSVGVKRGDRVAIYMPMIPEIMFSMLACARIGAVHSVVFGGFSSEALRDRINDSACVVVITANEGLRGGKTIPLKAMVDDALVGAPSVHTVLVARRTEAKTSMTMGRDLWLDEAMKRAPADCPAEVMDSEDPLFILYTSGSTGKPKGVLHTTGGYLLHAAVTHRYVFDLKEDDIYFCAADCGWVTGHSYVVYGPLCNGATTVMFESLPTYPANSHSYGS
jgi:acetyl-CoA synthetase